MLVCSLNYEQIIFKSIRIKRNLMFKGNLTWLNLQKIPAMFQNLINFNGFYFKIFSVILSRPFKIGPCSKISSVCIENERIMAQQILININKSDEGSFGFSLLGKFAGIPHVIYDVLEDSPAADCEVSKSCTKIFSNYFLLQSNKFIVFSEHSCN